MKIGILIDQLIPGGVQKAAIEEANILHGQGNKVDLLVIMRKRYTYNYEDISKGIKISFLSDKFPAWARRPIKFPVFHFLTTIHLLAPFLVKRFLPKMDYDFIISHGTTTCFTAQAIKRKQGLPYVAFIWDPMGYILKKVYSNSPLRPAFFILNPLLKRVESVFLKDALAILTCSRVHSDYIKQNYGLESYRVYPGAYPVENIRSPKKDFILALTRWDRDKKPFFLLDIVKGVPDSKLVMAGAWTNNRDLKYFIKQVEKLGLKNRVTIYDYIDQENLKDMFDEALVFIHVNFEAFGMGALEAAARGCPMIIPKGSGVTELFENGKHGYFPEAGNLEEFKNAVSTLVKNKEFAYAMGLAAHEVAKKYTWAHHVEVMMNLVREAKGV